MTHQGSGGDWLSSNQLLDRFKANGWPSSRRTLYRWIDAGLPHHQPGGDRAHLTFDWAEVERWVRSRCFAPTDGTRRHKKAS